MKVSEFLNLPDGLYEYNVINDNINPNTFILTKQCNDLQDIYYCNPSGIYVDSKFNSTEYLNKRSNEEILVIDYYSKALDFKEQIDKLLNE